MEGNFFWKILQGMLVGLGAVLPGISGGVLSVVFGIYRPMMELLAQPGKRWRTHLPQLAPYMAGAALGFFGVAKLLAYILEKYPDPCICVFVGLIGGMFPSLWQEAGAQGRKKSDRVTSCVSFLIVLGMLFGLQRARLAPEVGTASFLFCGFTLALSVIAPGMSFSALLMPLGLYAPFVDGIGNLEITVLLPAGCGCVLTFLCLAKVVNRLFERHYAFCFHMIFGIITAATVMTVPWESFLRSREAASRNLFCMAAGIVLAIVLDFLNQKLEQRNPAA